VAHVLIRPGTSPDGTGGYVVDASAAYENQAFYVDRGKSLFSHKTIIHLIYPSKFCITNFFLGVTVVPKEIEDNGYAFFLGGGGGGGR